VDDDPYDGLGYEEWRERTDHRWMRLKATWLVMGVLWFALVVTLVALVIALML
jgi:hypothetical protein